MTDIGILGLTLWLAHMVDNRNWGDASTMLFLFSLLYFQLTASAAGLYESQRSVSTRQYLGSTLAALLTAFMLIAMTAALSNRLHNLADRQTLLEWLLISAVALCLWRLLTRQLLSMARSIGFNTRTVGIAGSGETSLKLAQKFEQNPWMGLQLGGIYDNRTGMDYAPDATLKGLVGDFSQLIADARSGKINHVYIALPMNEEARVRELVEALSDSATSVFIIPDMFTFELMNSRQTSIDGIPAISIYDSPFTFSDAVLKRGFDIFGSLGILFVIAIPMLVIAAAIKLTSAGPVIFRQNRYGLDGKPIEVWKFRTMNTMDSKANT
ncbi:MAG: sugar transferase, partial [Moraxellaceae bacterium]|nr:sugar transferase [Moraxellaceae bacterium]